MTGLTPVGVSSAALTRRDGLLQACPKGIWYEAGVAVSLMATEGGLA